MQNLYAEVIESKEKTVGLIKGCPGLSAAVASLPTAPLRALLSAGSPLWTGDRCFAVGGAILYEVFANGTFTALGNVGDDATHTPATLIPNGTQLGIVSAGRFYLHNGVSLVPPVLAAIEGWLNTFSWGVGTGNVTRTGERVDLDTGSATQDFSGIQSGDLITINGLVCHVRIPFGPNSLYTVESLTDPTPRAYSVFAVQSRIPDELFGDRFIVGQQIAVSGISYKITNIATPGQRVNVDTDPGNSPYPSRYLVQPFNGTAIIDGSGVSFRWLSGDRFPIYGLTGGGLLLDDGFSSSFASVEAVVNSELLTLSGFTSPGTYHFGFTPVLVAGSGTFLDSYFVLAPPDSKQLYVSAPLDGTSWDAADVAAKESYPDNIGTIYADHEELYVMGETKSEVWRAPGVDANFPFQRDPGAALSVGIAAPASFSGFLDGVAWIGASLRGKPVAYYAKGYQPERISTHAIEQAWEKFAQISDAQAFPYEMDGHEFWQVSFPTADQTWVYDRTASLQFGQPMWHERNSWDGAAFHRHRARCHCFAFGKHLVGDFANGNIYEMSSSIYTDAGQPITCIRTLPHLSANRVRQFFTKWQLDFETGGDALTVILEWSDDGGTTFEGGGSAFTYTASSIKKLDRVTFWQLGSAEDRVFRLTITGNARKALVNAYLDVIVGT